MEPTAADYEKIIVEVGAVLGFLWAAYISWGDRKTFLKVFKSQPLIFKPFGVMTLFGFSWLLCWGTTSIILYLLAASYFFVRRMF